MNGKGKTLEQEFAEACREAVQPDLDAAKKAHFEQHGNAEGKVPCEVTGEMVAIYESHLDHKKPMTFEVIVRTFVAANKLTIRPEMLSISGDAQFVTTFADEDLRQKFREYHNSVADLRIASCESKPECWRKESAQGGQRRPVVLLTLKDPAMEQTCTKPVPLS